MTERAKHRPRLLCSTGAFSRDPDLTDIDAIVRTMAEVEADGFEVIFYPAWYDTIHHVADRLARVPFPMPVLHTEKSIGPLLGQANAAEAEVALHRLELNCVLARATGAETVVLHLWGLPDSDRHIERNLSHLDACFDICRRYGLDLAVETIPCLTHSPVSLVERMIAEGFEGSIALDTEFLAMHDDLGRALASEVLWKPVRVSHIHVKDYDGTPVDTSGRRRYLHPGEGTIDLPDLFRKLKRLGFSGSYSLESSAIAGNSNVDVGRISRSLALL